MTEHTSHEIKTGLGSFIFYGTHEEAEEIRRGLSEFKDQGDREEKP